MTKLARKAQKVFAGSAGTNQIAEFGSLAASAPVFTTDPDVIQALSQFTSGWFAAVIGSNSPAIEEMNALCFLFARQLAYIFQAGVAEWDVGTIYYIGSVVNDGTGLTYVSIADNNTANALTDGTKWTFAQGLTDAVPSLTQVVVVSGKTLFYPNFTVAAGKTWTVNAGAALTSIGPVVVLGTLINNGTMRVL